MLRQVNLIKKNFPSNQFQYNIIEIWLIPDYLYSILIRVKKDMGEVNLFLLKELKAKLIKLCQENFSFKNENDFKALINEYFTWYNPLNELIEAVETFPDRDMLWLDLVG